MKIEREGFKEAQIVTFGAMLALLAFAAAVVPSGTTFACTPRGGYGMATARSGAVTGRTFGCPASRHAR